MSGFKWYAGDNEEVYHYGPHDTREAALDDAFGNSEPGDTIHVIEAVSHQLQISARRTIETMLDDSEELYGEGDTPERVGSTEAIRAADAELQALLDDWLDRHRATFNEPTQFAASRSRGTVIVPADGEAE